MSTFVVRVVDSSDGRLRGVVERISDERLVPFSDSSQLIALLNDDDDNDDDDDGDDDDDDATSQDDEPEGHVKPAQG